MIWGNFGSTKAQKGPVRNVGRRRHNPCLQDAQSVQRGAQTWILQSSPSAVMAGRRHMVVLDCVCALSGDVGEMMNSDQKRYR